MLKDRDAVGPVARAASPCPSGGEPGTCPAACAGCGGRIMDRYYLLAVDRQWHSPCLKCCECKLPLDTELTCFARDGNIYCKEDYYRLFAIKRCNRCQTGISASELVMRAKDMVFHLNCFTCTSCGIPLSKGDHFGMRNGLVYCHPHYELLCSHDPYCGDLDNVFRAGGSPADFYGNGGGERGSSVGGVQKGRPRKRKLQTPIDSSPGSDMSVSLRLPTATLDMLHPSDLSSSMESISYDGSLTGSQSQQNQQNTRTKRMRTSFKHHQLRTMKSYFAINQNPDAKDLKQLAQKTGLSKRVLQVWFQNARAKWRRNLMRQESGQNQQQPGTPGSGTSLSVSSTNSIDCPSSLGPVLINENNGAMTPQNLDEMHHMHHPQGQNLGFASFSVRVAKSKKTQRTSTRNDLPRPKSDCPGISGGIRPKSLPTSTTPAADGHEVAFPPVISTRPVSRDALGLTSARGQITEIGSGKVATEPEFPLV